MFDVEVTIPNQDGRLRPGMIGTVGVRPRRGRGGAAAVPTAPLTAIVRPKSGAGEYAAFVVERQGDVEIARLRACSSATSSATPSPSRRASPPASASSSRGASLLVDGEPVRVFP